ncbi:ATP-dependent zinc protease [Rubrivirga sp. IMCC45206]|uniref:ATP-dependent zinc protease family protein n=1 Tax=Rubrivirga sp. IMCC45206 TaxID=3391614 RepID=UPI0039901B21
MTDRMTVGWQEWLAFPELNLPAVRAKIDTGARTSALHAREIRTEVRDGETIAVFVANPLFRGHQLAVACEGVVVDEREVTSSSGHTELRVVIEAMLRLGLATDAPEWPVELSLTDRDGMRFPMLLGREAMSGRVLVDSGGSYLLGRPDHPGAFYE